MSGFWQASYTKAATSRRTAKRMARRINFSSPKTIGQEHPLMEAKSKQTESLTQLVRSDQIEWKPLAEPGVSGVFVKVLRFDRKTRRAPTILLKFAASATYPAHDH